MKIGGIGMGNFKGPNQPIQPYQCTLYTLRCAVYDECKGVGQRPNQSYLPLGCKARFRLNADTTNGCLRISSFHKEHNHDNTEEDYLRVINKRRRNVTGETTLGYKYTGETAPDVNEHANTPEVTGNNSAPFILTSENHPALANPSQENSTPVASSPGNSALHILSQENSAFVPVTRPAEMTEQDDGIQQMSQQNLPPIGSVLRQIFAAQLLDRFQRIEYLIMNAYIINCGRCLPQEVYLPFIFGVYGADYCLSEWSDVQLRDVMIVLLQPPEILLQGKLPTDISINEVKRVRPPCIQRAIAAIREEKLKRCDKIVAPFVQHIFNAISRHDFSVAVREFKKFADDVRNMSVKNIKS
uniref:FLYWCH-type domain-containing protein n=1 Tax=Loa loa TaxID=7209 RepID=A0A1I7W0E8_LOALO